MPQRVRKLSRVYQRASRPKADPAVDGSSELHEAHGYNRRLPFKGGQEGCFARDVGFTRVTTLAGLATQGARHGRHGKLPQKAAKYRRACTRYKRHALQQKFPSQVNLDRYYGSKREGHCDLGSLVPRIQIRIARYAIH